MNLNYLFINSFNQNSFHNLSINEIGDVLTNFLNNVSLSLFLYIINDREIIKVKKKCDKNNLITKYKKGEEMLNY